MIRIYALALTAMNRSSAIGCARLVFGESQESAMALAHRMCLEEYDPRLGFTDHKETFQSVPLDELLEYIAEYMSAKA